MQKAFVFSFDDVRAGALRSKLEKAGWEVDTESTDGSRGFRRLAHWPPDMVVIDLGAMAHHGRVAAQTLATSEFKALPVTFIDAGQNEGFLKAMFPNATYGKLGPVPTPA
jgi:DNA-binding NarL/FixJ family response regulator